MWCPVCGSEYQPGISRCPDCDVDLVSDAPTGPRPGLPDRSLSSWPFDERWAFPDDPGAVFGAVAAALGTLGWPVRATDEPDRVVGASTAKGPELGLDVEVHVLDDAGAGSLVRVRIQTKVLAEDFGRSRADAERLVAEVERSLGTKAEHRGPSGA